MTDVSSPQPGGPGKASESRAQYSDTPVGAPVEGCSGKKPPVAPRPSITSVTLVSVAFLSDHGVLKNHDDDWNDGGVVYERPHWSRTMQRPVSHTGGQKIHLRLFIAVEPDDAAGTLEITGRVAGSTTRFHEKREITGGVSHIELSAAEEKDDLRGRMPAEVQCLDMKIHWLLAWTGGDCLAETRHTVFVTLGTPATPADRPGITLKRMREAVRAVGGTKTTDPHSIVDKLMSQFATYNLDVDFRNAWQLADDLKTGADCQTIVRYVRQVLLMVGCPGEATFVVVWAGKDQPAKALVTRNAHVPNTVTPKQYRDATRQEWATLVDLDGRRNLFEACLEFTHGGRTYLYAGGVGRKDNADEVLHTFFAMCWADEKDITGIIHRYRKAAPGDPVVRKLPPALQAGAIA